MRSVPELEEETRVGVGRGDEELRVTTEPPRSGPTVHRMLLGLQLRRLRDSRGVSREDAGYEIRCSESKISRLELGRVSFKERDVEDLLTLYGVVDAAERERLLALARRANEPGWWQGYSDVVPGWFQTFLDLEEAADFIRAYEVQFVPGLFQTEDYARTVITLGRRDVPADAVERWVGVRMARQRILTRPDPPKLWMVVDEAALLRPIGGRGVMRTQLEHIAEVAARPNVTLQVMPLASGSHPPEGCAFTILRFPDKDLCDVVYLEHLDGALYLDKRDDADRYLRAMTRLGAGSSTRSQTADVLARLIKQL